MRVLIFMVKVTPFSLERAHVASESDHAGLQSAARQIGQRYPLSTKTDVVYDLFDLTLDH